MLDRSIWLDGNPPDGSTQVVPATADVVVVGAGLAGLCTAWLCAAAGQSVVVVEAHTVARRTTAHSTAKLTALHGLTYAELERAKGPDVAGAYAAGNVAALDRIRGLIETERIDCGLTEADAFTCAATPEGVAALEAEQGAAARAGLGVELTAPTELGDLVTAAVRLPAQAHFDPYAFCVGLVDRLRARGVSVVEGRRVNTVTEDADACHVGGDGFAIRCDSAVLATHLPISDPALIAGRVRPERSYAVAGPVGSVTAGGMYLAHDAGWSLRPASSPDGPMLIVGGEGHAMTDHVDSARHYAALTDLARHTFDIDATHRWSAFDYVTTDLLPYIGRLSPRSRRRYVATGFRKWGMTTSMLAAMIISDQIAGTANPYAAPFDATRLLPAVGRDLVANSVHIAERWIGDRIVAATTALQSKPELAVGEGRIETRHGAPVAVVRDADGVHVLKATCPHQGCLVGFNDAEQTWDCPCHGSRFTIDGQVIDGPAVSPLPRVEPDPAG